MKTHAEFIEAVAKVIGKAPDRPETPDTPRGWVIDTEHGLLDIWPRKPDSAELMMRFAEPFGVPAHVGSNTQNGHWNLIPPVFLNEHNEAHRIYMQREAVVRDLQRRLARIGYVPPEPADDPAPLPGNDFVIAGDPAPVSTSDFTWPEWLPAISQETRRCAAAAGVSVVTLTLEQGRHFPRCRFSAADGSTPLFRSSHTLRYLMNAALEWAVREKKLGQVFALDQVIDDVPALVPVVTLVTDKDEEFPGLRVLEIRAAEDGGLRVAVELDGFLYDPEAKTFRAWKTKGGLDGSGEPVAPSKAARAIVDRDCRGGGNLSPDEKTFLLDLLRHEREDICFKVQSLKQAGRAFALISEEQAAGLVDGLIAKLERS